MIISLSDLVNMCKMQTNSHFQTRSERLLIIHIKEYINWKVLGKFDFLHLIMMHLEGKLFQVYDGNYFFSIFIFVICSTEFP